MVGPAQERLCPPYACTRRANQSSRQKPVYPLRKKYFTFAVGQISSTSSPRPFPARGALRGRHERGMGCGGRGSVGAQMESQGGFPVSEEPARRRTALQRLGQNSTGSTWSVETLVEVAAYGEVVWSWHPLLMPSLRRRNRPNRVRSPSIRKATVTKRNSSPRRARRKPLKPLRGESRVISGATVVTTVCLLPMHTGYGCSGHPAFPAPSSYGDNDDASLGQIKPREGEGARVEPMPHHTRSSCSAKAGHPVFQRRRCRNREAAAYWIPACAGYDDFLFCWRRRQAGRRPTESGCSRTKSEDRSDTNAKPPAPARLRAASCGARAGALEYTRQQENVR